jgi:putative toxin-antitoxin system antitoxin component (TIGR02293 family)
MSLPAPVLPETTLPEAEPDLWQKIEARLGTGPVRSEHDLARLVEARLPVQAATALLAHGLRDAELYALVLPRRTLAHRRARGEPLTAEESDRLVRVARLTALAETVFGEPARAWRWLRQPQRGLDGRAPLDQLASEAGARLVEESLVRIDHGLAA